MGRTVRIFHISDLHGRGADGPQRKRAEREAPFRYRVIGPEWDKNVAAIREDACAVDLVVFTGDLGDRGDATDYAMGVELLKRTCAALEVPHERLFVVPGNHDIARGVEKAAWKRVRKGIARAPREGSDWMAGGKAPVGLRDSSRDAILKRAAAFWTAVTDGLQRPELAPQLHPYGGLGYQVKVQLDGLDAPLWVIGLDTAWLAGNDADSGSLRVTEHQVELRASDRETARPGASLPGFRIALMHHRFADLADGVRARQLLADRVDVVLHGHQHEPEVGSWVSPDHDLLVLAAGCLYEGDEGHRYPNACQVIDVALTDEGRPERAVIRFRGWAERNGLFWGDDGLLYRSAKAGRLALRRDDRGWIVDDGKQAALRDVPPPAAPAGARRAPRLMDTPHRHPHRGLVAKLGELISGGGVNRICLPATPGLLIDRALDEVRRACGDHTLIEVGAKKVGARDHLRRDLAAQLTARHLLDKGTRLRTPSVGVLSGLLITRPRAALLISNMDFALDEGQRAAGADLIREVCELRIPIIFTSIYPLLKWMHWGGMDSPAAFDDVKPGEIADDWSGFQGSYGLDAARQKDCRARCSELPELFDLLARDEGQPAIHKVQENVARAIWTRVPSAVQKQLLPAARGERVLPVAGEMLAWARILGPGGQLLHQWIDEHWRNLEKDPTWHLEREPS